MVAVKKAHLSLPAALNQAQVSASAASLKALAATFLARRASEPEELTQELVLLLEHVLLVDKARTWAFKPGFASAHAQHQRETGVERVLKFVVLLATAEPGAECDVFCEALLAALLPYTRCADKAARLRATQLLAAILTSLAGEAELSDELFTDLAGGLQARLRDKAPAVRARAAVALSPLQCAGDGDDFASDESTAALLQLLRCDKSKESRKAALAALGVSDFTLPCIVERTKDVEKEVRRQAFSTLAAKAPLASLSIAQRCSALQRGLADREPVVRDAALKMLDRWMQGALQRIFQLC